MTMPEDYTKYSYFDTNLAKKLLLVQEELQPVTKDASGGYGKFATRQNLHESVLPTFRKHGLLVQTTTRYTVQEGKSFTVIVLVIMDTESGASLSSSVALENPTWQIKPTVTEKQNSRQVHGYSVFEPWQYWGKLTTYAIRHLMLRVLGVTDVDEDVSTESKYDNNTSLF